MSRTAVRPHAAGLKRGDVITALNGTAVKDSNVLRNEIAELQPGSEVKADRPARRQGAGRRRRGSPSCRRGRQRLEPTERGGDPLAGSVSRWSR